MVVSNSWQGLQAVRAEVQQYSDSSDKVARSQKARRPGCMLAQTLAMSAAGTLMMCQLSMVMTCLIWSSDCRASFLSAPVPGVKLALDLIAL